MYIYKYLGKFKSKSNFRKKMKILLIALFLLSSTSCSDNILSSESNSRIEDDFDNDKTSAPLTLESVNGAQQFSDGTFAESCLEYLDTGLAGSETSGAFRVDTDGAGPTSEFAVYCDMTTQGGGWTLAV